MKIEIRSFRSFRMGSGFEAFSCELVVNGVRRGSVENRGDGGTNIYSDRSVMDELDAFGATLPKYRVGDHEIAFNADMVVEKAIEDLLFEKKLRRAAKTSILVRHDELEDGSVIVVKLPLNEANRAKVVRDLGSKPGFEIVNDRFARN